MVLSAPSRAALALLALLVSALGSGTARADEVVEYVVTDALGNIRALEDEQGNVIERHDYLPFGEECTAGPCAANPGLGAGQPRKFTGKERDPETGLDYFGARYYSAPVGRFTTVDPVYNWNANLLDPQRWNRYAYGRNNPLRYLDPDGRDIVDYFTGFANAFGSNFSLGLGRTSGGNADFQFGQFVGDAFSIPAGTAWAQTGAGIGGLGILGAPETGGASLVATGAGVVMVVQGGTASVSGATNAGIYLAKAVGEAGGPKPGSTAGPGSGKRATPKERQEALNENNGRCVFCDAPSAEADHSIPKSRGGDTTTGASGNLQGTCQHCNRQKGPKTSQEYLEWKQKQN